MYVNPIRPRYTKHGSRRPCPNKGKPATYRVVKSISTGRAARGDWEGHTSKDWQRNLGDPAWWKGNGVTLPTCPYKVSPKGGPRPCRESDQSVVAMKRGNSRRAKGLSFDHV